MQKKTQEILSGRAHRTRDSSGARNIFSSSRRSFLLHVVLSVLNLNGSFRWRKHPDASLCIAGNLYLPSEAVFLC